MNSVKLLLGAASALTLLVAAACGGDDDSPDEATQPPSGGATTTSAEADDDASATTSTGTDDGGSDSGFSCPLSAERVGEILGATVEKDEATCVYLRAGNVPVAGFFAQLPELCENDFPQQAGYTEPVDGLGVDAFLKVGGAATVDLWVCGENSFSVWIDAGTGTSETETARAAAEGLAKAVLE